MKDLDSLVVASLARQALTATIILVAVLIGAWIARRRE